MTDYLISQLPAFASDEETSVVAAFQSVPALAFGQSWRQAPAPNLMPGHAKIGVIEGALWALAEMDDLDIYNLADAHNLHTWELGDVFEVFLQRDGERGYFEVHVTPDNYRLFLRFAGPREIDQNLVTPGLNSGGFEWAQTLTSHAWIHRSENRWRAILRLPGEYAAGTKLRISFCRYDATHGADPVAASTSPHAVADFHRPIEWPLFTVGGSA